MSIHHHPPDVLLTAYAAGTLDLGQHIALATHLAGCFRCADWVHSMEHAGGIFLADMPPAGMSSAALARVEARLTEPFQISEPAASPPPPAFSDVRGLPAFLRSYPTGPWKWIAPRMRLAPIRLPEASETRVFLLKSGPGTKLLEHTHTETEMTCVLRGSFRHEGGRFGAGDFDFAGAAMNHNVFVEEDDECVCLIAMRGELRLTGVIGQLMQPLVRM